MSIQEITTISKRILTNHLIKEIRERATEMNLLKIEKHDQRIRELILTEATNQVVDLFKNRIINKIHALRPNQITDPVPGLLTTDPVQSQVQDLPIQNPIRVRVPGPVQNQVPDPVADRHITTDRAGHQIRDLAPDLHQTEDLLLDRAI